MGAIDNVQNTWIIINSPLTALYSIQAIVTIQVERVTVDILGVSPVGLCHILDEKHTQTNVSIIPFQPV